MTIAKEKSDTLYFSAEITNAIGTSNKSALECKQFEKFSSFQTTNPIAIAIASALAPFHTSKLSNRITKKIHNAKANTHFE